MRVIESLRKYPFYGIWLGIAHHQDMKMQDQANWKDKGTLDS